MAEAEGMAYITEENEIAVATVAPNEIAVMANAILLGTGGHTVPRGDWTEEMLRATYHSVFKERGRIGRVRVVTIDN